jgi:hypothetical protein
MKETKKINKKNKQKKARKKGFFESLEDKIIYFGKTVLKSRISAIIKNKIKKIGSKIENEIKKKINELKKIILQFLLLVTGVLFILYGGFLLLMEKLELSEYSNILFGVILILIVIFLKLKK